MMYIGMIFATLLAVAADMALIRCNKGMGK